MKTKLFAITTFVLVIIHNLAGPVFHWYEIIPWFDNIPHFLAGVWLALLVLIASERYRFLSFSTNNRITTFIITISIVMLVSVFWEFFEFGLDLINIARGGIGNELQPTRTDVLTDLFFDFLGGASVAATFLVRLKRHQSIANENNTPNL